MTYTPADRMASLRHSMLTYDQRAAGAIREIRELLRSCGEKGTPVDEFYDILESWMV